MKITDLTGFEHKVADLKKALKRVRQFRERRNKNTDYPAQDYKSKDYWTDLYEKLNELKTLKKIKTQRK